MLSSGYRGWFFVKSFLMFLYVLRMFFRNLFSYGIRKFLVRCRGTLEHENIVKMVENQHFCLQGMERMESGYLLEYGILTFFCGREMSFLFLSP